MILIGISYRYMTNPLTCVDIEKSIVIKAAPEHIWRVLTDMEMTAIWAAPFKAGTYAESDWHVGSSVMWKSPDEDSCQMKGEITMMVPNQLLVVDFGENPMKTEDQPACTYAETYSIVQKDMGSILSIRAGGMSQEYADIASPQWDKALDLIKTEAEK